MMAPRFTVRDAAALVSWLCALSAVACSTTLDAEDTAWSAGLDESETSGDDHDASDDGEDTGDDTGSDGLLVPACDPAAVTEVELDPHDANALVSPARARAAIVADDGSLAKVAIAPHEFFNYYDFDYASAEPGQVTAAAELFVPDYDPSGEWVLQVGVNGPEFDASARPPVNLSLVLDTSVALEDDELALVAASANALVASLHPGDRVSILGLGEPLPALVENYEVEQVDDPILLDVIDGLQQGGDPELELALGVAYELADANFAPDWINRVVYIGSDLDGIEVIPIDIVTSHAGLPGEAGIYLVGAGVGEAGSYDGRLVEELTTAGRGTSLFIADSQAGWRAFEERFMSTMAVAALDLSIRVELPPGFRPAGADEVAGAPPPYPEPFFADLAAGRPLVVHERLENCAPEPLEASSELRVFVSWRDPLTFLAHETTLELSFAQAMQSAPSRVHKGRAVAAYADGLIAWQEAEDSAAKAQAIAAAAIVVDSALELAPEDADLVEISELLGMMAD